MRIWVLLALLAASVGASPVHAEEVHWQHVTSENVPDQTAVQGEVEVWPVDGGLQVRGWVVDGFSASRPDRVLVSDPWTGDALGHVEVGGFERRQDIEMRFGSSAYSLSGFQLTIRHQLHNLVVRAHLGHLGWWWAYTTTPIPRTASVTRLECVSPDAVEVELHSEDPFPVRNAILELRVGSVTSSLSRYGEDGDLHTIIFVLTPEQFAQVSETDVALVQFNPGSPVDDWQVGTVNVSSPIGC